MEKINVVAQFDGLKVKPLVFKRTGRLYKIDQTTLVHHHREGTQRVFNFHTTSQGNYFNLRFEPENLAWFLEEN